VGDPRRASTDSSHDDHGERREHSNSNQHVEAM
jgi:hypothetical protein